MTKSGKNIEKVTTSPMFPRLSLNDRDKGTRKEPPRNKMDLYEQFSMPSQKLISPTLNGSHLIPSNSSSHDGGHEKLLSFSFNAVDFTIPTVTDILEQKSIIPTNLSTSNGTTTSLSSNTLGEGRMGSDDLRVPLFSTIQQIFDKSKLTNLNSISRFQWQPTNDEDMTSKGTHVRAEQSYSIQPRTPHFNRESRNPLRHNKTARLSQESAATRKENIAPHYEINGHDDDDRHHSSLNGHRKHGKICEDWENEISNKIDGTNGNGGVSEASTVDCCLNISPDDVIGVIGEQHVWKARNILSRQQKIFAEQLFELHRLIKVQKAIAASPHLLLEDNFTSSKSPLPSGMVTRKLRSDSVLQPSDHFTITKDRPREFISTTNNHSDNGVTKIPLPSFDKQFITQRSNHGLTSPWSYNPPPTPPINQWLIPIMSPSQGLVYKPYAGPFPPPTGFMPPVYGNCRPMTLPSKDYFDSFTNQTYFPSYITPIMSPPTSNSAFDQTTFFSRSRVNEAANITSTYMTNKRNEVNEKCVSSKQSELLGSTESSSPSETEQCNAMPLFPMEPTLQAEKEPQVETSSTKEQTRVIKVVPHNPRVATETAARIFRSIQEERENCM